MSDFVDEAFQRFRAELQAVDERLKAIAARAVDEKLRDTAQRQSKHPLQSSTTLKEAKRRAHSALAKLEAEHAPTIQNAMTALAAINLAKEWIVRVDEAIKSDIDEDVEKAKTGLFKAVASAVQTMYEFGATKHHWEQQSRAELLIYSDLIRWKAEDACHDDPLSPWHDIIELYDQRRIPVDLLGKRSLSIPKEHDAPQKVKVARPTAQPPSTEELRLMVEGWGSVSHPSIMPRTEGPGRVPGEDQYGGYLTQFPTMTDYHLPMFLRTEFGCSNSTPLQPEDWSRIEVPRSVYALVNLCGEHPLKTYPQMFPPLARMRLVGVDLGIDETALKELEEAEAGEGKPSLLIETVRSSFLKYNRCHDEDLIRFWLFLLVGRKYPDRVDQLFPAGYFHGVLGPDAGEPFTGKSHFQIVRVSSDEQYDHMMRHPTYGPWSKL